MTSVGSLCCHTVLTFSLSFLSLSTAVGLKEDLQTQLSSTWGPYWQDNFGILRSLPMDAKIPLMSDNTWSVQVNPPLLNKGACSSFLFFLTFSRWILKDEALWIPLLDGKSRERVWLRATFSLLCLCAPITFPSAGGDGRWDSFFTFHSLGDYAVSHLISMRP